MQKSQLKLQAANAKAGNGRELGESTGFLGGFFKI
jgi:hypothetical protein